MTNPTGPSRRRAIALLGGTAAILGGVPLAFARVPGDRRFMLVILRGGMDGLSAVPPYADRDYRPQRGELAVPEPGRDDGALDLDGKFGLHPALAPLHEMYRQRELLVLHAVATPYRSRSHFDGQDLLENGTTSPRGAADGWLNRAVGLMGASNRRLGLAVGQTVPLVLRGAAPVGSWAPQQMPEVDGDFMSRLAALYRRDRVLGPAIEEGMKAHAMTEEVLGPDKRVQMGGGTPLRAVAPVAGAVGKLLAAKDGPRVAVMELGGWDTHSGQPNRLAGVLRALGEGMAAFKQGLGPAWTATAVAVVTEFGRTVASNGTNGTDHGTAGAAFLLGGAVSGGRVAASWPGLSAQNLFEGRDLAPTLDMRAIFKGLLIAHLGLPADAVERVVFPDSRDVAMLRDAVRA